VVLVCLCGQIKSMFDHGDGLISTNDFLLWRARERVAEKRDADTKLQQTEVRCALFAEGGFGGGEQHPCRAMRPLHVVGPATRSLARSRFRCLKMH
jgi:hypothetical protein